MGVDSSIKVRLFQEGSDDYKEIEVSEQDNSLASLFYVDEVKYTSIKFDRHAELTSEENAFIELTENEEEMMACTNLMDAKVALKIFDSIDRKLRKLKREALNNDLNKIQSQELDNEEKEKRKKAEISEYLGFESSFNIFKGIIKTAVVLDFKIQIVVTFY
jgi:hypothetical protein